jgi:hypothetical protein
MAKPLMARYSTRSLSSPEAKALLPEELLPEKLPRERLLPKELSRETVPPWAGLSGSPAESSALDMSWCGSGLREQREGTPKD